MYRICYTGPNKVNCCF